jgi:hypothetical protein
MKMRCWACAVLGLVLFCAYARAEDKPSLPVLKKGYVISVSDKDLVIQSEDKKVGDVTYPIAQVSQQVKLSDDVVKKMAAEEKTKGKYFAPAIKLSELQAGTEVSVEYGFSAAAKEGGEAEKGSLYQVKVTKLTEVKK